MGVGSKGPGSRTTVSASREGRHQRSPLHGETRHRSSLSAASTARSLAWRMTPSCWLVNSATVLAIASGVNRRSGVILKYRRHQAGTTMSGVTMCRDLTHEVEAVKPDFCSNEGACVRFGAARIKGTREFGPPLSSMGVGSNWLFVSLRASHACAPSH